MPLQRVSVEVFGVQTLTLPVELTFTLLVCDSNSEPVMSVLAMVKVLAPNPAPVTLYPEPLYLKDSAVPSFVIEKYDGRDSSFFIISVSVSAL